MCFINCLYCSSHSAAELGVTEHIAEDGSKFAIWTGLPPNNDDRKIVKVKWNELIFQILLRHYKDLHSFLHLIRQIRWKWNRTGWNNYEVFNSSFSLASYEAEVSLYLWSSTSILEPRNCPQLSTCTLWKWIGSTVIKTNVSFVF